MPATSSGRIVKSSKGKKGTAHTKNHRWESFTAKIAKLNSLDPIKRVRRYDLDAEDLKATTSYFKNSLEKWSDLNVSGPFVEFRRDALPLCDSLAQIIHHEAKIMDLLEKYLSLKIRDSVEPLLGLLTDFAHDLGKRFEKYYERALRLVILLVTSISQDVEVIEWSFGCLAFLFKYLSKLLVSNLRPTYDILAPLLGKEKQKPHVARFAGEAMSFLIRKAATPANRDTSLEQIVRHIKTDLLSTQGSKTYGLYYHGVMTLFAESMKGNGQSIHSSATAIINALIANFEGSEGSDGETSAWEDVIRGVLTSNIHHSDCDTFEEVIATVLTKTTQTLAELKGDYTELNFRRLMLFSSILGVFAGVRKGTRIADWKPVASALAQILEYVSRRAKDGLGFESNSPWWPYLILPTATVLDYGPMDILIPHISGYMDALTKDPLAKWFLTFCGHYADANTERFRSIILPYFQRFVVAHWSDADHEDTLCVLLPQLVWSGALNSVSYGKEGFQLPQSWQDQIVSKFERLEASPFPEHSNTPPKNKTPQEWHERCLPKYRALLKVLDCTVVHPSTNARIAEILLRKLKLALRPSSALAPDEAHFIVGTGLYAFCKMASAAGPIDASIAPLLRAAAPRYSRLPGFLDGMILYEELLAKSITNASTSDLQPSTDWATNSEGEVDVFIASLIENLSTESHDLRQMSLRMLQSQYQHTNGTISPLLNEMLMVENTPLSLDTVRSIQMHIRQLATMYKSHTSDSALSRSVVAFCFGMMTVKLAPVWKDANDALSQISETNAGEEIVAQFAFKWLEQPSMMGQGGATYQPQPRKEDGLTDFECSNLMKIEAAASDLASKLDHSHKEMLQRFEVENLMVPAEPRTARAQALRVLNLTPKIAERRSRQLVPMFLSYAGRDVQSAEFEETEDTQSQSDWSRADQKSLLSIFCLFNNPKVLYRNEDVFSALLVLLQNGDVEIQKSALKAIFTWKLPYVKPYEEQLLNLLDEARFKDDLTVLIHNEESIQAQHREEVMAVILRILYGRSISRGKTSMEARRITILRALTTEDIGKFMDLVLGPLINVSILGSGDELDAELRRDILDTRKQVGFMNMIEDILRELGSNVTPFTAKLIAPILYCHIRAVRLLQEESEADDEDETSASQTSMLKVIRQLGYKCLILLSGHDIEFNWEPYLGLILGELVEPRLANLPTETAQGVSGVLRLLSAWSNSAKSVLFLGRNAQILPKISECLVVPKAKHEVQTFALNILRNVLNIARDTSSEEIKSTLLEPNMDTILTNIGHVLRYQQDPPKDLLESCVETVVEIGGFVTKSTQAHNLVDVAVFLLNQPSKRVNPKAKSGLLQILEHFVPLYDLQNDTELRDKVYDTVSSLFGFFRDARSRDILSRVLVVYAREDPVIADVASLCADLNSFIEGRLEEPDYDRRLRGFTTILRKRDTPFTSRQWRPLLYNMLFYIRHDEEFGILSSNSSDALCSFLDTAKDGISSGNDTEFKKILESILLPALYSGVREQSEIVRREYLKVMAHLVKIFSDWEQVNDMIPLLGGDDELEASFFNNILTAGKGRQSKALALLSKVAEDGVLRSRNVGQFLIPLIEHFVFDRAEGAEGHNLAAEATTVLGVLARSLEWQQYRALLRRFITYITSKPDLEKQIIRLIGRVIDALAQAADEKSAKASAVTEQDDTEDTGMEVEVADDKPQSLLAKTLPSETKFTEDLESNILPPLTTYLHDKDESTVSLRVPVAVILVRLLKLLPQDKMMEKLPPVLTDICHILRSKAQESRDMTRDTLIQICVLLGANYFGFVLKELRGALTRGYQLHVLSYTMHSILVATTPEYAPGDLDYCLPDIVSVIMDDIFGVTGQEKDAEEYTSKMKEVKSSKSHDSMELIATTATLTRLTDLVRPIQTLLQEKLDLRMVRKIDELLNRITTGLLKNAAANSRDSLIFCYEVIQEFYSSKQAPVKERVDPKLRRYLVQRGAEKSGSRSSSNKYTFKLVRFAFDIMRTVLKKHDNLRTAANLAGFVPIIGDAVLQAEEEVKVSAFKLLTTIVKVPLKYSNDGTDLYKVSAVEAMKSITSSSSTTSELSQAALRLLSVIMRDRQDVKIKESQVDDLLAKLRDDFTEPEYRHVTFNFLRAVLDSKLQTAGVYDTLDFVGTVMVTNDDSDTRDLARGAYFQFLREYPQMKKRWSKQLQFIVANLKYEREGGRLSILEVIHLLLVKSSSEYVQEVSATCFVPLMMVLGNDDSEKCRMAAGEVIKEIFRKADREKLQTFTQLLQSWVTQEHNPAVMRLGFFTYDLFYQARDEDDSDFGTLLEAILPVLRGAESKEADWESLYAALQLTLTLTGKFPARMFAKSTEELWKDLKFCLSYPHAWVKLSSAKLLTTYLADFARANAETGLQKLPLSGSGELKLKGRDIAELVGKLAGIFNTPGLTEALALEAVKNLAFLAQAANAANLKWTPRSDEDDEDVEEESELQKEESAEGQPVIGYLFRKLSWILRKEITPPRAPFLVPKTSALQLLTILVTKLPANSIKSSLDIILLPLQQLTDPSIPVPYSTDDLFKTGYEALKGRSSELMQDLQDKIGTAEYTAQLLKVREGVRARRTERSSKRKIEAITAPEKFGREKQRKVERKKERRKEKGMEHRERRKNW
jgi:U3 small nucleolar RNA-associated protein 20